MSGTAAPRVQVGSIFGCYGVAGFYWGAFVASLPAFEEASGLDPGPFGILLTAQAIGGIVAMQGLGRVLHRVQRFAIPGCFVLFAVGMTLLGLSGGPVAIGLALLLCGAASGALDISLNMRVARIESDLDIRLFNRVHALFPFSMLCTSALVGVLRDLGATPAAIFPGIAVTLLAMAAVEARAGAHQRPAEGAETAGRPRVLPIVLLLGALAAMGATMEGGAHVWSAIFVERHLGAGPAWAGFAAAAITLGLTTGRLIAHRLENGLRDMSILRIGALTALPGFLILGFADSPVAALLGFFVAGVGIGPVEPSVFRSVAKRHDEVARGRALALATGLAYVGYLAAPPALGQIIDAAGWPPAYWTLAGVAAAAAALTLAVPRARP